MTQENYVSKKNKTYTRKKSGCRSDMCTDFRCMSRSDTCGHECSEVLHLCAICTNRGLCEPQTVKDYVRETVNYMKDKKVDKTFSVVEISGEQVLNIHVRHKLYERNLSEIRKDLATSSGLLARFRSGGLVSKGEQIKVQLQEIRDLMDIIGIEYVESVSVKPQY